MDKRERKLNLAWSWKRERMEKRIGGDREEEEKGKLNIWKRGTEKGKVREKKGRERKGCKRKRR